MRCPACGVPLRLVVELGESDERRRKWAETEHEAQLREARERADEHEAER